MQVRKNIKYVKQYIWNPATCSCRKGKGLANYIENSVITCDEIIEEKAKSVPTNFNEKKACKTAVKRKSSIL